MNIRMRVAALLSAIAFVLSGVVALGRVVAPQAQATMTCGLAICFYTDINYVGSLGGGMKGGIVNLLLNMDPASNDKASSIWNTVAIQQACYWDINGGGLRLTVQPGSAVSSLVPLGWNDVISSFRYSG